MKNYTILKKIDKDNDVISLFIEIYNGDFSLFRYRSINEYTLSALISDKFFLSSGTTFTDPYDIGFKFDREIILEKFSDLLNSEYFQNAKRYFLLLNGNKESNLIQNSLDFLISLFNQQLKASFLIACFSEKANSEIMWAHYADEGKGFMMEYRYKDLIEMRNKNLDFHRESLLDFYKDNPNFFENGTVDQFEKDLDGNTSYYNIVPIIYKNGKFNASYILNSYIILYLNILNKIDFQDIQRNTGIVFNDYVKEQLAHYYSRELSERSLAFNSTCLYMKNADWKYEKEWRFALPNFTTNLFEQNRSQYAFIQNIKPKAIILGEFISEDNEKLLVKIASEKQIRIHKMYTIYSSNGPRLKKGKPYNQKQIETVLDR